MSGGSLFVYVYIYRFERLFPICQPQDRKVLTTLGVIAAVNGTLMKMKLL